MKIINDLEKLIKFDSVYASLIFKDPSNNEFYIVLEDYVIDGFGTECNAVCLSNGKVHYFDKDYMVNTFPDAVLLTKGLNLG